jgi:hypothetical protein
MTFRTEKFSPTRNFNTPVLLLGFNRPDLTSQIFEAIRLAQPPRLYFAVDGARSNQPREKEKVIEVIKYVTTNVDWKCELKTLIRDKNLGCKHAVKGGIDWFFENEPMGIILEDDCLPTPSFFWFCENLLELYREDARIGQICGFNPLVNFDFEGASYGFSKYGPIWGWASWRRAWKEYDVNMSSWPEILENDKLKNFVSSRKEERWRKTIFQKVFSGEIDTWDYQWSFAKLINKQLSVIPRTNLIENIGFGADATHTKGAISNNLTQVSEILDIKYAPKVVENMKFNQKYLDTFVFGQSLIRKVLNRVLNVK